MNLDEKIERAAAYKETLTKQIKAIQDEAAGLQQRYQQLLVTVTRAEGALAALHELKDEMDKHEHV
jgi:prefoldin subunit 5